MTEFLDNLQKISDKLNNLSATDKGATTLKSSLNYNVDFFFKAAAMRTHDKETINVLAEKATIENNEIFLANILNLRDCRNGAGEKRTAIISFLTFLNTQQYSVEYDLLCTELFLEHGYYKDILSLMFDDNLNPTFLYNACITIIKTQLNKDLETVLLKLSNQSTKNRPSVSLLAKWMPSVNCTSKRTIKMAKKLASDMKMSVKEYRQMLSSIRQHLNLVETKMCNREFDSIEYSQVPSKAGLLYRNAFLRNDESRYTQYIESVSKGEQKINTGTLNPYNIVHKLIHDDLSISYSCTEDEIKVLDTYWDNLKNQFKDVSQDSLVMCDVSGSMKGTPLEVALALTIYIAERNKGIFHNKWLSFSATPKLHTLSGNTLSEKIQNIDFRDWNGTTNLESAFDIILTSCLSTNDPQANLPKSLYIISDMEFDACTQSSSSIDTVYKTFTEKYAKHNLKLPNIIFWNVDSKNINNIPVEFDQHGTALISGYSTNILQSIIDNIELTPLNIMNEKLKPYIQKIKEYFK